LTKGHNFIYILLFEFEGIQECAWFETGIAKNGREGRMNKKELVESMAGAAEISKAAAEKTKQDVETITIDEVMKLNNLNKIDILKFDIQGGELMALQGAEHSLQQQKISIIYTEALFVPHYEGNPLLRELWNYLVQYDYTLFDIYDMYRATNGQLRFADAIFISKEARSKVLDSYSEEP
jgi:hypothetical protein